MDQIPTATLLVSYTHQDEQEQQAFDALAKRLSGPLNQPVIPCPLDGSGNPLLNGITTALRQGAAGIVTLPLFLSPAEYQDNVVAEAITFASRRWPFLQFHLSPPPDWLEWLRVVSDLAADGRPPAAANSYYDSGGQLSAACPELVERVNRRNKTAIILAGRGETDSDINSDVAKLARLLYEASDVGWVDVAFVTETTPSITDLLARYQTLDTKQVSIIPGFLFAGNLYQKLFSQVEATQNNCQLSIAPCLSACDTLIEVLLARYAAALEDRTLLPLSWEEVQRQLTAELNTHNKVRPGQPAPDEDEFRQLASKIDAILPPRYKGRTAEISATPMAAADLVFDDDGGVAWDQIFGVDDPNNPFCELALAGGPSHRGELLEPPLAAECQAEAGKTAAVLAEIERGIRMITGLPVVKSKAPGWIGIQCDSEAMAIWLMRAIIVENVMVRREGDVIYLPAGPHFTLKNEIKSIVTVTAKTWHYWIEHITYQELLTTAKASTNGEAVPEIETIEKAYRPGA